MNNKILPIGLLIIVLALAGFLVYSVAKAPSNTNSMNDSRTDAYSANADQSANAANNSDQANANTAANIPAADTGECVRDFKPEVLKEAKAPTEQFVIFSVKGFGDIKVQLYPQDAPKASENMARLVKAGYYDCIVFHRVIEKFVIQAGDPTATGRGGESAFGAPFADELNPNTPSYKTGYVKGILAMANSGPNTNGSQFFITTVDANAMLSKDYTIFGKVVSGLEVVDKIAKVPVQPGDRPTEDVVISKAVLSAK